MYHFLCLVFLLFPLLFWVLIEKENLEKIEEDDEDDSEYQREEDDEFEDPNNETINTTLNDSAISGSTFPSVTEGTMA